MELLLILLLALFQSSNALNPLTPSNTNNKPISSKQSIFDKNVNFFAENALQSLVILAPLLSFQSRAKAVDGKGQFEYQPALQGLDYGKPRTYYPDYIQKPSGLQYKLVKEGTGPIAKKGDKVTIDWEGYTIGYYGRPFETRNKVKGGAFDSSDTDYYRWVVGSGSTIQALDEAVSYLSEGSIAQVVVPAELGYPVGDSEHEIVGPKPLTFSGLRALNFVLENKNLIDKTLLINVKVIKVDSKRK